MNRAAMSEDILLGRIIDGLASAEEWSEFERRRAENPSVAERLVASLRAESSLAEALAAHPRDDRDLVALRRALADEDHAPVEARAAPRRARRRIRFEMPGLLWTGWAAAACVLLTWTITELLPHHPETFIAPPDEPRRADGSGGARETDGGTGSDGAADIVSVSAPAPAAASAATVGPLDLDEQYDRYIEHGRAEGRILAELPVSVLRTRVAAGGGSVEVVYMRRIVETVTVDGMYRLAPDEHGQLRAVPVRPPETMPARY